jgi:hypothetical protein
MVIPRISDDMSSEPPSARWLVRELVSRAAVRSKTPTDLDVVAFEACEHTYRDLAIELGAASAQALVNRARVQAGTAHPALLEVHLYEQRHAGVPVNSIAKRGDSTATAEELETLLETLLALLGRFVGINIVVGLVAPRTMPDAKVNEGAR